MKLLRIQTDNQSFPCILDKDENIRILENTNDITPSSISKEYFDEIANIDTSSLKLAPSNSKILPCVKDTTKVICIGLNYSDHCKETGMEIPKEPLVFSKAVSSIIGPNDDVFLPPQSKKSDWEVELGIIVQKKAKNIDLNNVNDYIAGYTIVNDISERYFQLELGGQFIKGKSYDTFCPVGPYLVTKNEINNVNDLSMSLKVNNQIMQNGSTKNMIFKPEYIVYYLSKFMTLMPGDIIPTGTPPGVGMGHKPPVFLKKGDVMELEIENLGKQKQKVF